MYPDHPQLAWMVGIMEGEGSFCCGPPSKPNQPRVDVAMGDEDVVARLAEMWSVPYYRQARRDNCCDMFRCRLKGGRAVAAMQELLPYMGQRRRQQMLKALDSSDHSRLRKVELPEGWPKS